MEREEGDKLGISFSLATMITMFTCWKTLEVTFNIQTQIFVPSFMENSKLQSRLDTWRGKFEATV